MGWECRWTSFQPRRSRALHDRPAPERALETTHPERVGLGVRALDGLVPCGEDSASASSPAPASARARSSAWSPAGTSAQVDVVALVGERGREVGEFLER